MNRFYSRVAVASVGLLACSSAWAQFFNVDIDCITGLPILGEGVPSSTFAGAGYAGTWNSMDGISSGPTPLVDLGGNATGVTLTSTSSTLFSCLGYNNPTNTGDYNLLLNDASQAGFIQNGGSRSWTFNNLANGSYRLITYGAAPQGVASTSPITVSGSITSNPQTVFGPMTGNALGLGITHVFHDVIVTTNTLTISSTVAPFENTNGSWIQGFQLIPEPASAAMLALGAAVLRRRRK